MGMKLTIYFGADIALLPLYIKGLRISVPFGDNAPFPITEEENNIDHPQSPLSSVCSLCWLGNSSSKRRHFLGPEIPQRGHNAGQWGRMTSRASKKSIPGTKFAGHSSNRRAVAVTGRRRQRERGVVPNGIHFPMDGRRSSLDCSACRSRGWIFYIFLICRMEQQQPERSFAQSALGGCPRSTSHLPRDRRSKSICPTHSNGLSHWFK